MDHRPTRLQSDPQRRALGEQRQEQAEEADEYGEVRAACSVVRGVLVRVTHRADCGVVLYCMLRVAGALWRVAEQVQGSEDPVAEEQRADEQHG
jgi:hypothetical protein